MSKKIIQSVGAVLAGFLAVAIFSVVTDIVVEKLGILPPANSPELYKNWHLGLALLYRSVFTILGGYVTAALSPNKPIKHVIILAIIGTITGTLGTIANWDKAVMTGAWYPVVLLLTSPIFIVIGGKLRVRQ